MVAHSLSSNLFFQAAPSKWRRGVNRHATFYSALLRAVTNTQAKSLTTHHWQEHLRGLLAKGEIKKDELEHTDLIAWFDSQSDRLSRQQVLDYLEQASITINEVTLGKSIGRIWYTWKSNTLTLDGVNFVVSRDERKDGGTKHTYNLFRNGVFIKEGFATARQAQLAAERLLPKYRRTDGSRFEAYQHPGGSNYREVLLILDNSPTNYKTDHWPEHQNVLAHIRLTDRVSLDGLKILFVEEIQSDWAQEGRKKGFNTPIDAHEVLVNGTQAGLYETPEDARAHVARALEYNEPQNIVVKPKKVTRLEVSKGGKVDVAPFVLHTDKWLSLVIKRIAGLAAGGDYDGVAFAPGINVALINEKVVYGDTVVWNEQNGQFGLESRDGSFDLLHSGVTQDDLPSLLGAALTKELLLSEQTRLGNRRVEVPPENPFGADGMLAFYDEMIPNTAKRVLKKLDGTTLSKFALNLELERQQDFYDQAKSTAQGFLMSSSLRQALSKGMPLFSLTPKPIGPTQALVNAFRSDPKIKKLQQSGLSFDFTCNANVVTLDNIFVEPAHRGNGVGTAALHTLTELADEYGVFLDLEVGPDEAEIDTPSWYTRNGFEWSGDSNVMLRAPKHNSPAPGDNANLYSTEASVWKVIDSLSAPGKETRRDDINVVTAAQLREYASTNPIYKKLFASVLEKKAQAFYDPELDQITLVPDHIPSGKEASVFLHEIVHKHGQDALDNGVWNSLINQVKQWQEHDVDTNEYKIYSAAHVRALDGTTRNKNIYDEELFAYAVEEAVAMGITPSALAHKDSAEAWLDTVVKTIKNVQEKLTGVSVDSLTTQELVDLSYALSQLTSPAYGEIVARAFKSKPNTHAIARSAKQFLEAHPDIDDFDIPDLPIDIRANHVINQMRDAGLNLGVDISMRTWQPYEHTLGVEITDFYADVLGEGRGTRALTYLSSLCDALEIGVYLKPSSERNRLLYGRHGFARSATARGFLYRAPAASFLSDDDVQHDWQNQAVASVNNATSAINIEADQTQSGAFKKWFGDSKVVDAEGKPLVVYHGTKTAFDAFDMSKAGQNGLALGAGFYFTDSMAVAKGYGDQMPVFLAAKNPTFSAEKRTFTKSQVRAIIVALEKQDEYFLSNYGDISYEGRAVVLAAALDDLYTSAKNDAEVISGFINVGGVPRDAVMREIVRITGKDGFIANASLASFAAESQDRIFTVLLPEQIKSATGNNGEFDASNPDIRFSLVYHGSPHRFLSFDSSRIGAGEGGQAYGYGLYLAELPDVAKTYLGMGATKGGASTESKILARMELAQKQKKYSEARALEELLINRNPALAKAKFSQRNGYSAEEERQAHAAIDDLGDIFRPVGSSSLYRVDLPDKYIAMMLDWDKPIIEQQYIVNALSKHPKAEFFSGFKDDKNLWSDRKEWRTGKDLYGLLDEVFGKGGTSVLSQGDGAAAADELRKLGIPGIRYLDGGSRDAGAGTSNFVVFPGMEHILTILDINGKPLSKTARAEAVRSARDKQDANVRNNTSTEAIDSRVRFSFAGQNSHTADVQKLHQATVFKDAGAGDEQIRVKTGWHAGADGKWRYEIDDSQAQLLPGITALQHGGHPAMDVASIIYRREDNERYSLVLCPLLAEKTSDMAVFKEVDDDVLQSLLPDQVWQQIYKESGDPSLIGDHLLEAKELKLPFPFEGFNALPLHKVLHHPTLFAAYPTLRDIPVSVVPSLGAGAVLVEQTNGLRRIELGNRDQLSALMHEVQHYIQEVEQFARGGSISEHNQRLSKESMAFNEAWHALPKAPTKDESDRVMALYDKIPSAADAYKRLAGEVEARNTSSRLILSQEERLANPPEFTEDIARSEQIIKPAQLKQ